MLQNMPDIREADGKKIFYNFSRKPKISYNDFYKIQLFPNYLFKSL